MKKKTNFIKISIMMKIKIKMKMEKKRKIEMKKIKLRLLEKIIILNKEMTFIKNKKKII